MPRVDERDRSEPTRHAWGAWVAQWLAMFAAWTVFVGTGPLAEWIAGVLAAAVAATASHVVFAQRIAIVRGHPRWFLQIWRLPRYALAGTAEILAVLFAQWFRDAKAPSLIGWVPYAACAEGPDAQTQRALAIAYTTMTPNFIVFDIAVLAGECRMVYHQIRPSDVPEMTRRLGAEP